MSIVKPESLVYLSGLTQTANVRVSTYQGQSHLVVPTIMLVGGSVVRPMNSTGDEYIPTDVLKIAPGGWNTSPILGAHPKEGTAGLLSVLESQVFGLVLNARMKNDNLVADSWLNISKAEDIGRADLIEEIQQGQMLEISVGAYVVMMRSDGVSPKGVPYQFVWQSVVPDHLAIGLDGAQGACSNDMGCGMPRTAAAMDNSASSPYRVLVSPQDEENTNSSGDNMGKKKTKSKGISGLFAALREQFVRVLNDEGESDRELRSKLWELLNDVEPSFGDIEEIFFESKTVIYYTLREDTWQWWRRTFDVTESGEIVLGGDPEEVEPTVKWELVAAEEKGKGTPCSCGGIRTNETHGKEQDVSKSKPTSEVSDLVTEIISLEGSPFEEDDRDVLSGFSKERLESIKALAEDENPNPPEDVQSDNNPAENPPPDKKATDGEPSEEEDATETVQISPDELSSLRAAARKLKAQEDEEKSHLVKSLKDRQDAYSEQELKSLNLETLRRLSKVAPGGEDEETNSKVVDFSAARGAGRASNEEEVPEAPDFYERFLESRKNA